MPQLIKDIDTGDVEPVRLIDTARSRGAFVFDLETTGLVPRRDRIEGIAFYVPPDEPTQTPELRAWYPFIPDSYRTWVQPDDGGKPIVKNLRAAMPQAETMAALRPLFEESPGTIAVAHNCLQYNTRVLLADGSTELIGKIVNQRLPVSVMSWDGERFVAKRVTNWWRNGRRDDWYKLTLSHKPVGACLYVTGDHEVYLSNEEKRRVADLRPGDVLLRSEPLLSPAQKQVVLGTALGDGSFTRTSASVSHFLSVGHAPSQEEYLDWKVRMLGRMVSSRWEEANNRGFSAADGRIIKLRTINSEQFSRAAETVVVNGRRRISEEVLENLDARGLAVWYMDDGSVCVRRGALSAVRLHVYAYPIDDVERLCHWLAERWSIIAKKRKKTDRGEFKGYYIEMTGENALAFSKLVAPFVVPSMSYKLAPGDRGAFVDWTERFEHPSPATVVSVGRCGMPSSYSRVGFDLEVEDTHRYFASGILVSNCKFDVAFLKYASGCARGYWMERSAVDQLGNLVRDDANEDPAQWWCNGLLLADSMLADFLCDENLYQYGLKHRVKDVLGHEMTTYVDVARTRKQGVLSFMADDVQTLGYYAMEDCYWTWRLFEDRMRELDSQTPGKPIPEEAVDALAWLYEEGLKLSPFDKTRAMGNLERLFWGIDMRICQILEEMESTGILIDWKWLRQVTKDLEEKKEKIIRRIEERIGWTLNPNSQPQVSALLFSAKEHGGLGLNSKGIKRGKSGGISTGSKEIGHLRRADPIVADILDWRSADTVRANFSEKLARIAQEEPDCRVYSHFNQTGTVIHRLSCIAGSSKLAVRVGNDEYKRSTRISELLRFSGQTVTIETHKGRERRITHLVNKGPGFMFDVETDDGCKIRCTADHRFLTERGWRALKDIRVGDRLVRAELRAAPAAGGRTTLGSGSAVVPADLREGHAGGALEDPGLRAVERDRAGLQGDLRLGVPAPVSGNADEAAGPGGDPAGVPDVREAGALQGVRALAGVVPGRVRGQRSDAGGGEGAVRHRAPVDDSSREALPRVLGPAQGQAGAAHQRPQAVGGAVLPAGGAGASAVGWDERGGGRSRFGSRVIAGPDGSAASRDRAVERERFALAGQLVAAGAGCAVAGEPGDGSADRGRGYGLSGDGRDVPAARGACRAAQGELVNAQGVAGARRAAEGRADLCRERAGDAPVARADGGRDSAHTTALLPQKLASGLRVAGEEADGRGRWRVSPEVRDDQEAGRQEGAQGEAARLPSPALHDRAGGPGAADRGAADRGRAWMRVAAITPVGVETVWDITVEDDESYVAHGFLNHNSSDPVNLQNQPRDRNLIRKAFCAYFEDELEPDMLLFGADYGQVELRVAAHLSGDEGMTEVYQTGKPCTRGPGGGACERYKWWECENKDDDGNYCGYTWVPEQWDPKKPGAPLTCPKCGGPEIGHQKRCRHVDLHQRTAEDVGVPRNPLAKNANFGLLYRMAAPRFCQYADLYDDRGEPMIDYAQSLIDGWFAAYPAIQPFHDRTERWLRQNGWYACTLTGRRRRLDRERWKNEYRAVTQGIQFRVSGSAQDILKRAMVDIAQERERRIFWSRPAESKLWRRLRYIIQVHDEVMLQGPAVLKDETIDLINTKMCGAATLSVPLTADCKSGRTWDDIH